MSGGVTPNLPQFPQGANYTFQNQPAADTQAFGGIQSLQNYQYLPQPGQYSVYNPGQAQVQQAAGGELGVLQQIMGMFQPGTPSQISQQYQYGNQMPASLQQNIPQSNFGQMPTPQQAPQQQAQPSINSQITPQMAQLALGIGSSGQNVGAASLTGPMMQSLMQIAQGGGATGGATGATGNNPSQDAALAQALLQSGGTPNLGNLNPGQLAELNQIAGQQGYQGGQSAYNAQNPYWMQSGAGSAGAGGTTGVPGAPGSTSSGGTPSTGAPGSAGAPGTTTPGAQYSGPGGLTNSILSGSADTSQAIGSNPFVAGAGSGQNNPTLANPSGDIFARFAPILAALGMQQGPQGQALQAGVLQNSNWIKQAIPQLLSASGGLAGNIENASAPLPGMAASLWNQGADPQQALYDRTLQQVQQQGLSSLEQQGVASTPYGAGVQGQTLSNFNIDWQNQQLQRALQAGQGANSMLGTYNQAQQGAGGLLNQGASTAGSLTDVFNQSAQAGQSLGQQGIQSMTGVMNALQGGAMGATAQTQQQISDFLNYLGAATSQNQVDVSGYAAQVQAALGSAQLQQQANQAGNQLGLGAAGLGLKALGKG